MGEELRGLGGEVMRILTWGILGLRESGANCSALYLGTPLSCSISRSRGRVFKGLPVLLLLLLGCGTLEARALPSLVPFPHERG